MADAQNLADKADPTSLIPPASTTNLKGNVALGLTFDASDTRKFSLDVTALTKVTCEMVAVPPPRQLMAIADRMAGVTTPAPAPAPANALKENPK